VNLAWLAAVLTPREVAPHPNFSNDVYDALPAPRLAAVILGDTVRLHRLDRVLPSSDDDVAVLADRCLRSDSIAVAVSVLADQVMHGAHADPARATALALLTCAAASELDEYDLCFDVIDAITKAVVDVSGAEGELLRCALLQQRALRSRDAGLPYRSISAQVCRSLRELNVSAVTFETSPGINWRSEVTTEHLRNNLFDAAAAMLPAYVSDDEPPDPDLPTWQDRVRAPQTAVGAEAARLRAEAYVDHARSEFEHAFSTVATVQFGGTPTPDVFRALLMLELHGHPAVDGLREELALWRLVRGSSGPTEVADALRLLRQASSKQNLDRALRRVAYQGPLAALNADARQVMRNRLSIPALRAPELAVLTTAADVLAAPEARVAFDAVRRVLAEDGPRLVPGTQWQLETTRKEPAWVALAALAAACDANGEAADVLLGEVQHSSTEHDQLFAGSLRRALHHIAWDRVDGSRQRSWLAYVRGTAPEAGALREAIETALGVAQTDAVSAIEGLVRHVNAALRGDTSLAIESPEVDMLRDALASAREQAARGLFSFGGIDLADVAAAIVELVDVQPIWESLADYLVDMNVIRRHKSSALDRLARGRRRLPTAVMEAFVEHGARLLREPQRDDEEFSIPMPYPSALRFLAARELIDDADMFDALAALAGTPKGRHEAALSMGVIALTRPMPELLALALPLARDHDVETRAHAGRALALLAYDTSSPLAAAAERALYDLLGEDGALAPRAVLDQISSAAAPLTSRLRARINDMARNHQSRAVRRAARNLLGGGEVGGATDIGAAPSDSEPPGR
jgi:hypothetical protein